MVLVLFMSDFKLKLNKKLRKTFFSICDEIIKSKFRQRIEDFEQNQEILDILYQNSPYYEINCFENIFQKIFFIITVCISFYLPFMKFYPEESILAILSLSIVMFCGLFFGIAYPLVALPFCFINECLDNQLFDNKRLDMALLEIKRRGLYPKFLNHSLFNPIINPSYANPITYNEIKEMFKTQNQILEDIVEDLYKMDKKVQKKQIVKEQKSYIDKYR